MSLITRELTKYKNLEVSAIKKKPIDKDITAEEINHLKDKVEDFLNDKNDTINATSDKEVSLCFEIIKYLYNDKIREYIKELNLINDKLSYYDKIIEKKLGYDINSPPGDISDNI